MEIEERIKRIESIIWPPDGPDNGGSNILKNSANEIIGMKKEFAQLKNDVNEMTKILIEVEKEKYARSIIEQITFIKETIARMELRLSKLEENINGRRVKATL